MASSLAVTPELHELAAVAAGVLARHDATAQARGQMETEREDGSVELMSAAAELGWFGLHLSERVGGSGFGWPELVVVLEQFGWALAPGAFVGTVAVSGALAASPSPVADELLPALAAGAVLAAAGTTGAALSITDGRATGDLGVVVGAPLAGVICVPTGADVVVIRVGDGVAVSEPSNLDPTRRAGRVTLSDAPVVVIPGAAATLRACTRLAYAAEAVGVALRCTTHASEYATQRRQFGQVIGVFQAVKHHCANMLVATESASAAVWAAADSIAAGGDVADLASASAAVTALPAALECAQLNVQVHGGIGYTWEHDAHLALRRAGQLVAVFGGPGVAAEVVDLTRSGVPASSPTALPEESAAIRSVVRDAVEPLAALEDGARLEQLVGLGFALPQAPTPWGRGAGPLEQLVIREELDRVGVALPDYGPTRWIAQTLIEWGSADQIARWVADSLRLGTRWCQLFSEPDAGSDAAGITTAGVRVDGGWVISGQKVWSSGAHVADFGFATIRTDPAAAKHHGITTMVVDMGGAGVEVRPLRNLTGEARFNEVFLDEVFVPDDCVVGPVNEGWRVARSTFGYESEGIGANVAIRAVAGETLVQMLDDAACAPDCTARVGSYVAARHALVALNRRRVVRQLAAEDGRKDGLVTKVFLAELVLSGAALALDLVGPAAALTDDSGGEAATLLLTSRMVSIGGGTTEIKRNQIAELLLGLPRDPLMR